MNSGRKIERHKRVSGSRGKRPAQRRAKPSYRTYHSNNQKLKLMKARLKNMVGEIKDEEEIISASKFLTSLLSTENDKIKYQAWREYTGKLADEGVAGWHNMIIFRVIGKTAQFFISQEELEKWDLLTLDELEVLAAGWMRLAFEGRLSELEDPKLAESPVEAVLRPGPGRTESTAIRLKEYMVKFQEREDFENWNYEHMKHLRYEIYDKLYKEPRSQRNPSPFSPIEDARVYEQVGRTVNGREREESENITPRNSLPGQRLFTRNPAPESGSTAERIRPLSATSDSQRVGFRSVNSFTFGNQAGPEIAARSADEETGAGSPIATSQFRRQLEQQKSAYKASKENLEDKERKWEEAKATADDARRAFRNFDEKTHKEVDQILRLKRDSEQSFDLTSAREQASAFREFGEYKEEEIGTLLGPLTDEENATEELRVARTTHNLILESVRSARRS